MEKLINSFTCKENIHVIKKYIASLILLFMAGQRLTAQSFSDDNFVHTVSPKKPVSSSNFSTLKKEEKVQNVTYFDGLGRPVQTTSIGQGGDGSDLIKPVEYDAYGRQVKDYLPYALTNSTTLYPRIGMAASLTSLSGLYKTAKYDNTTNPYSEKQLESSPLNRVLKRASPGVSWEMGKGHEIKLDYQSNVASEVRFFKAVTTWNATSELYDISLTDAGDYAAGELYKNLTYDENTAASPSESSGSTVEFKNKEGQMILKRTYGTVGAGTVNEKHDTYYVYDSYGNLTYVLPPKAEGTITAAILNDLCYQYKYDHRNRLVEKKLPGRQWEFIIYDKLDRVVATGPSASPFSNLTSPGWLITKYDVFNRAVITGWMPASSVTSLERTSIQKDRNSATANFSEAKSATLVSVNGVDTRYTNLAWPTNSSVAPLSVYHILTVNYYDNYDYPGAPTVFPTVAGQVVFFNNSTSRPVGLATGSWTRVLESSTAPIRSEAGYILYDDKARAIRSYTSNFQGGSKQVDTNFDFTGKTIYTITTHQRLLGGTVTSIRDDYSYTDQDRLESVKQTIAGSTQLLAFNEYDALGQLISKKTGNTQGAPLQKVDYTYNIRGWLTGINNVNQLTIGTEPKDLFAFQVQYDGISNASKKLYNGNISQTLWASDNNDKSIRNYTYGYDALNRLKSAVDNAGLFNEENIQYDKNGNILKLQRKGAVVQNPVVTQTTTHYGMMDDLKYDYDSGNKLMKVSDVATIDQFGFKDDAVNAAADTADDYTYDANGNMLTDANKGITTSITYNHLNLPVRIVLPTGNITYLYNAAGQKIQKTVVENSPSSTTITEYLNGFQYKKVSGTFTLEFFPTQEGYVAYKGGSISYVFQYKDHLGNVRLSYAKNTSSGLTDIIEENNYYAFGMEHQGYNNVPKITYASTEGEKYKFLSQERQDELGLNWDTFRHRNYDYAIGRFFGIDPVSEEYMSISTYQFAHNNPVWKIEIEGLEGAPSNGKTDITNHEPIKVKNTPVLGLIGTVFKSEVVQQSAPKVVEKTIAVETAKKAGGVLMKGMGTILAVLTDYMSPNYGGRTSEIQKPPTFTIDEKFNVKDYKVEEKTIEETGIKRHGNAKEKENRYNHIFGKEEHDLDSFVQKAGSEDKAYNAVQNAANEALANGELSQNSKGILPNGDKGNIITVNGMQIRLIGGRVSGDKVIISSFSRKGL
ncbi:DUF6443 domain-containing protein [Flavobacterium sp. 1355]|uniref:DUF6443 domain-containing protein n=1 Tax=Flavobacterium sp. 1355 TaxID=2806571 RepID=UPI001AE37870|nr:DUF6443 domain-containing protein [Flavobacterium sp. 1355]MBP1221903.1 RHS repeat-associated protein [Flavobacterium sp. 1355]